MGNDKEEVVKVSSYSYNRGVLLHYTSAIRKIEWMTEWFFLNPTLKVIHTPELKSKIKIPTVDLPRFDVTSETTEQVGLDLFGWSFKHKLKVYEKGETQQYIDKFKYSNPTKCYYPVLCDALDCLALGMCAQEQKFRYYDLVEVESGKSYIMIDRLPNPDAFLHSVVDQPKSNKPVTYNCCCVCCPVFSRINFNEYNDKGIHNVLVQNPKGCYTATGAETRDIAYIGDFDTEESKKVKLVTLVYSKEDVSGTERVKKFIAAVAQGQHSGNGLCSDGSWEEVKDHENQKKYVVYKTTRKFSGNLLAQVAGGMLGTFCKVGVCCASCFVGEEAKWSCWQTLKPFLYFADDVQYKAIANSIDGITGYEVAKSNGGSIIIVPFEGNGPPTSNPMNR